MAMASHGSLSGHLDAMIAQNILDRQTAANRLKVIADPTDLRIIKVAMLDLGDLTLTHADACSELRLR